jgi:hypothetical protein
MKRSSWFLASALACSPASLLGGTGGKMSDETAVRQALGSEAPGKARVQGYSGAPIAGARLYTIEGAGVVAFGVGVVDTGGAKAVIRGEAAFRQLAAGVTDARSLAELAVHFLERGQSGARVIPTSGPAPYMTMEQEARVSPPSLAGDVLTYWRWPVPEGSDRTATAPEPWRCSLDMRTLQVACAR